MATNTVFEPNKYKRINQRCEKERSIEASERKQQNDIEVTKTSIEVARSRKEKKEETRKMKEDE